MPDNTKRLGCVASERAAKVVTELGLGWSVEVRTAPRGARLALLHPQHAGIDLEILVTAEGPLIRTRAAALQLSAVGELSAECESFELNASATIALRAPHVEIEAEEQLSAVGKRVAIAATQGNVQLKANDDVQLLGEQILLNCEREQPLPAWLTPSRAPLELPTQQAGGDELLLQEDSRAS